MMHRRFFRIKVAEVDTRHRAAKRIAAKVVEIPDKLTLQGFLVEHPEPDGKGYSGEAWV